MFSEFDSFQNNYKAYKSRFQASSCVERTQIT